MTEVTDFPTNYTPEDPLGWPDLFHTTAGYEQHQAEVIDWLNRGSQGQVDIKFVDDFKVFADRYGFGEGLVDPEFQAVIRSQGKEGPVQAGVNLQRVHVRLVVASPFLGVFQKGDLLTLSARYLSDGKQPTDGGLIVRQELHRWTRGVDKVLERHPRQDSEKAAIESIQDHNTSLDTVIRDSVPPTMSKSEFYKHYASVVSGQRVTSVLKALAILLTDVDRPSFKQLQASERRRANRDERSVSFAQGQVERDRQRMERSVDRLLTAQDRRRSRSTTD